MVGVTGGKLFADCLTKPIAKAQLLESVLGALAKAPSSHPRGSRQTPAIGTNPPAEPAAEKPVRVLVAEDNAVYQKIALRQLQQLGFRADAVGNGLEVLDACARVPYDIVIMDCHMPEMDGYEATRRLRRHESGMARRTTIIAMTASDRAEDRDRCFDAGMDDFLSKPVQFADMSRALERWLDSYSPSKSVDLELTSFASRCSR